MKWLIRLYPSSWRERYAEEFAALLEQCPLTLHTTRDVILGALDAWWAIHKASDPVSEEKRYGTTTRLIRLAGFCAILAALLSVISLIDVRTGWIPWYNVTGPDQRLVYAALSSLTLILVLLGFGGLWLRSRPLGRTRRSAEAALFLMAASFLAFAVGRFASVGQGASLGMWPAHFAALGLLLFLVATALTGLVAARAALLPPWITIPLALGPLLKLLHPFVLTQLHPGLTPLPAGLDIVAVVLAFTMSASWALLGGALLRTPTGRDHAPRPAASSSGPIPAPLS